MKRKQINRGKKWLVAVLPPTTFVTITNQKCQLYQKTVLFLRSGTKKAPQLGQDATTVVQDAPQLGTPYLRNQFRAEII